MREAELEKLMHDMGVERQRMQVESNRRNQRESLDASGRYLLREAVSRMEEWIDDWRGIYSGQMNAGRPTVGGAAVAILEDLETPVIAFIACQAVLNGVSQSRSRQSLAFAIGKRLEEEICYQMFAESDPGMFAAIIRTRTTRHGRQSFQKKLKDWADRCEADRVVWDFKARLTVGILLLEGVVMRTGLVTATKKRYNKRDKIFIDPTDETIEWLEKSNEAHEVLFPYYLPTFIPPNPWRGLQGGGYFTNEILRTPLVRLKWSSGVSVSDLESYDWSRIAEATTTLQNTPWVINDAVYETLIECYSNSIPVPGLPRFEDRETPSKPETFKSEEDEVEYKIACGRVHAKNKADRNGRLQMARMKYVAERYRGKRFFYPTSTDSRGRYYPIPMSSDLHPQGPKHSRSLLNFADAKPIENQEQLDCLKIHGANCWGEDKVDLESRLTWVEDNEEMILGVFNDPLYNKSWIDADNPVAFLSFCMDWGAFSEGGWGTLSGTPVVSDGTNNGLQIYSLMLRDPIGGKATNCIPSDVPQDIYRDVADIATESLKLCLDSTEIVRYRSGKRAVTFKVSDLAAKWLLFTGGSIPRTATKRPVMTLPYGLRLHSALKYVAAWYREHKEAGNESPWGDSDAYLPCTWLGAVIWDAIEKTVKPAREAMGWLMRTANLFSDAGLPIRWTSPSGFTVIQNYPNYASQRIRTQLDETLRTGPSRVGIRIRGIDPGSMNKERMRDAFAPNFIHSLDAACTTLTIEKARAAGITSFAMIHDSYGTVAADAPLLQRLTREAYAEVFSGNLLESLRIELQDQLPSGIVIPAPPEQGDLDPSVILDSNYFFN